jgi:hypothetical protein
MIHSFGVKRAPKREKQPSSLGSKTHVRKHASPSKRLRNLTIMKSLHRRRNRKTKGNGIIETVAALLL